MRPAWLITVRTPLLQDYTNQAGSFMPVIVKSLTSSMHRSFRGSSGAPCRVGSHCMLV